MKNRTKLILVIMIYSACLFQKITWAEEQPIAILLQNAKSSDALTKQSALARLGSAQPTTAADVDILVAELRSQDPNSQKIAGQVLGNVSSQATPLASKYLALLDDNSKLVQMAGIQGLVKLRNTDAVPKIRSLFNHATRFYISAHLTPPRVDYSSVDFQLEAAATKALIDFGDDTANDEILRHDELMLGMNAGLLLSQKYGAKVLPQLISIAKSRHDVRSSSARQGIFYMEDETAIPQLIELLKDEDLHFQAIAALAALSNKSASARSSLDSAYSSMTLREKSSCLRLVMIGETGPNLQNKRPIQVETLQKAQNLLTSGDLLVEYQMVETLALSKDRQVVPILENYLKDPSLPQRDSAVINRAAAAWGLWKITGKKYPVPFTRRSDQKWFHEQWDRLEAMDKEMTPNKLTDKNR